MTLVLLVEDNQSLAFGLRNNLEIEGYRVLAAETGPRGLELARREQPDVVLLDLMLPDLDGFTLLETLRREGHRMPVLILTALGAEADKVKGLKLGADDYVTKPFGVLELLARVEALLRRAAGAPGAGRHPVVFGAITVDPATRSVTRAGRDVPLAPKEFDLLWALVTADGAVVSRGALMQTVWGYQADVLSRTVDTHVGELRRKLEGEAGAPQHIVTVRKVGYRLVRLGMGNTG